LLSSTRTQGISVSVVAMGNVTKLGLVSLVENEHNLFTRDAADAVGVDVPWIVDFICQGTFYYFVKHIRKVITNKQGANGIIAFN